MLKQFTHARWDKPPRFLHRYPHLINSDAYIWERFLAKFPNFFDEVAYDIHVGDGIDPGPEFEDNIRDMAINLTKRRIDVLALRKKKIWIVELKKDPGVTAIGQLVAYKLLLEKAGIPRRETTKCLITNRIDPDLKYVLKQEKTTYFIV